MPDKDEPEADGTHATVRAAEVKPPAPKIEGGHTQEIADPVGRLPEDPDEQNDLA